MKILIVDNDKDHIDLCTEVLDHFGFHVQSALGGKEAISIYIQNGGSFDLVITDLEMPDMSGVETAEAIKKIKNDQLVMLVTGAPQNVLKPLLFVEIIKKPYLLSDFIGKVLQYCKNF